jgi:hypothetical protein
MLPANPARNALVDAAAERHNRALGLPAVEGLKPFLIWGMPGGANGNARQKRTKGEYVNRHNFRLGSDQS